MTVTASNYARRMISESAIAKADSTEARIALPWPPSTNNLFVNVPRRGRVASGEYARWRHEAGWLIQSQHPTKFDGSVTITVELCSPNHQSFDPDNRLKAPIDLLTAHGVIVDDSNRYVRSVSAVVVHDAAPCTVIVRSAQ